MSHRVTCRPGYRGGMILSLCSLLFSLCGGARAQAAVVVDGAGAAASAQTIINEEALYTAANPTVTFPSYIATTSLNVQTAVIDNDASALGTGLADGAQDIILGSAEEPLSAAQILSWNNVASGAASAGHLIQIPAFGASLAIPLIHSGITANGQITLSDAQLCGIFSGAIQSWNQLDPSLPADPINVIYRTDAAGTTFQLTQHLAASCNSSNSNFDLSLLQTTATFTTLFANGRPPVNFIGQTKLKVLAGYLNATAQNAISYISPDWTSYYPNSSALLANGAHSSLVIAALKGSGSKGYLPSLVNIKIALANAKASALGAADLTPPQSQTDAASPANWIALMPEVTSGYPIVSYTAFVLPQCFQNLAVTAAVRDFLTQHYTNPAYIALQNVNGQVQIAASARSPFLAAIRSNILGNHNKWDVDIGDKKACAGLAGR